jgi:tRNA A37 threonylcarbamoyladenosine dehydratase
MTDYEARFSGAARLFSVAGLARLRAAHVCVVGLGGVGSWAVEALARSGVGALTLVDLDDLCLSNLNRQLPALDATLGRPKVEVMAERVRGINPDCVVRPVAAFFTAANAAQILAPRFDSVLDAIDTVANKVCLIGLCRQRGLPVVTCGAAGGRRDPTRIRTADLTEVSHDRLLFQVRRWLRKDYGFPRGNQSFHVTAVFSPEPPVFPQTDGSVCRQPDAVTANAALPLKCDVGLGTAAFVTGVFGLVAAGVIVRGIAGATPAGETGQTAA